MSLPQKVLTFDIGIRNLAWCFMERSDTAWTILGWDNYDLLAGESTQDAKNREKYACSVCGKKAAHRSGEATFCTKHCPVDRPTLRDLSGALLKAIPTCKMLEKILGGSSTGGPRNRTRAGYLEFLEKHFSLPIEKVKTTKSKSEDFISLHNSIQKFVDSQKTLFKTATQILLENQPAFKNPTMKSVQVLLFATLRERLFPSTPFVGFVHAGKKVKGVVAGDAGYTGRKKGSELRVAEFFEKGVIVDKEAWKKKLAENQKKSDLCDAMCMCMDRLA